ncbi:PRC-barrel domain-containing protein [Erythrobacter sp.]|jgi:sporulation protein YlmC with PRC-barrel domain|uniref:PRC-barrel domain-containing protein n=1 Tax=Erythrobacter sp. TaxID=1042 RepID=UPI002EB936E9|nr:PRC-barrel domain-containing protein [Erythrobacter sp.]
MSKDYEHLKELSDYQLVNDDQDLRGRPLYTTDGTRLGVVERMMVDPDRDHVAALVLEDGRLVPVSEIEIRNGRGYIDPVDAKGFNNAPAGLYRDVKRSPVTVRSRH